MLFIIGGPYSRQNLNKCCQTSFSTIVKIKGFGKDSVTPNIKKR